MQRIGISLFIFWVGVLLSTAGCVEVVKESKKVYREYVDSAPPIKLESEKAETDGTTKLARLFSPVDERLHDLLQTLDHQDSFPMEDWPDWVLKKYDWISGIAAVTKAGDVLFEKPGESIKEAHYTLLLPDTEKTFEKKIRSDVDQTPFGAEVYLGGPFYKDNEWQGLLVARFDFRSLVKFSESPDELMVISDKGVLWPGQNFDVQELSDLPWTEVLKDRVSGKVSVNGRGYRYISRYLGQMKLVYVVKEG